MREMQREFSTHAKSIRPGIPIGYHIWHNISFNPIYRAEQDYRPYTEYADFLKPVVYDNPAGERMTSFVDSLTQNVFGDLSRAADARFRIQRHGPQGKVVCRRSSVGPSRTTKRNSREQPINGTPRGPFERFSSDYMYRETKRAVEAVAGSKTRICAGLGIDVQLKNSTPESVRDAVEAVFGAGAPGSSSPRATRQCDRKTSVRSERHFANSS